MDYSVFPLPKHILKYLYDFAHFILAAKNAIPHFPHANPIFHNLAEALLEFTTAVFIKHILLLAFVTPQCFLPIFLAIPFQSYLPAPPPLSSDF